MSGPFSLTDISAVSPVRLPTAYASYAPAYALVKTRLKPPSMLLTESDLLRSMDLLSSSYHD